MKEAASASGWDEELVAGRRGEGRDGAIGAPVVTAFMLEGRMLRAASDGGEPDAGAAGGGICCDEVRRDKDRTRGDAGTELRSGMVQGGKISCGLVERSSNLFNRLARLRMWIRLLSAGLYRHPWTAGSSCC